MKITQFIIGLILIIVGLIGAFYPIIFKGVKDPELILEVTFFSIRFWVSAIIGTIGAFLCYYAR